MVDLHFSIRFSLSNSISRFPRLILIITKLREIKIKTFLQSWTSTWGNQGYFWIARGTDECGIEDQVVAGLP
jgi:hypothetical protein